MGSDTFIERMRHAASLVESGQVGEALDVFRSLENEAADDLDKSLLYVNMASAFDKLGDFEGALSSYEQAIALEMPHQRYFAREQKAAFLAARGRNAESLDLYRKIQSAPNLAPQDARRIQNAIEVLERQYQDVRSAAPYPQRTTAPMGPGGAFVLGGVGCFAAFLIIGLLFVLIGGSMHIDCGGVVLLFLIGGTLGLVVRWIYNMGRRDAAGP